MESKTISFSSLNRVSKSVIILLYISIAFAALSVLFHSIYAIQLPTTSDISDSIQMDSFIMTEEVTSIYGSLYTIFAVALSILFLYWFYKAYRNLYAFGATGLSSSPRMAVVWFLVPIANLVKPYYRLQEIWKVSSPNTPLAGGEEWKQTASSEIIKIAWIAGIISIAVSYIGGVVYGSEIVMQEFEIAMQEMRGGTENMDAWPKIRNASIMFAVTMIVSSIFAMVAEIYYIKIIKQIDSWQGNRHIARPPL